MMNGKNHVNLSGINVTVAALLTACLVGCRPHCGPPLPYLPEADEYDLSRVQLLPAEAAVVKVYPLALRALTVEPWGSHYAFDIAFSGPQWLTAVAAIETATNYRDVSNEIGKTKFIRADGTGLDWCMSRRLVLKAHNYADSIIIKADKEVATQVIAYTVCTDDLCAASKVKAVLSEDLADAIVADIEKSVGKKLRPFITKSRVIPIIRE